MNYLNYTDLSNIIKENLSELEDIKFDLIVGIPRSGMIPAYMISLYLNINCCSLQELISNNDLMSGNTRRIKIEISKAQLAKRILLVDDSIFSGKSMKEALSKIPVHLLNRVTTLAVVSTLKERDDVDMFFKYMPLPRVFEWNIFHHSIIKKSAFDIDGVLCVDPTNEENNDDMRYIEFILNAKPLFIPNVKIDSLVTNRLEKYRVETEVWLKKNNVQYEKLIMLNLGTKEERQRLNVYAKHKAKEYMRSDLELFVESDFKQAIEINKITKKPVLCVETNEMITSEGLMRFFYQTKNTRKSLIRKISKKIPKPIFVFLRRIYKKVFSSKDTKSKQLK